MVYSQFAERLPTFAKQAVISHSAALEKIPIINLSLLIKSAMWSSSYYFKCVYIYASYAHMLLRDGLYVYLRLLSYVIYTKLNEFHLIRLLYSFTLLIKPVYRLHANTYFIPSSFISVHILSCNTILCKENFFYHINNTLFYHFNNNFSIPTSWYIIMHLMKIVQSLVYMDYLQVYKFH